MIKTRKGKLVGTKIALLDEGRVVISVPEAALLLEMSRDAAYRAAKAGTLPAIKIGGLYKVPVAQLRKLLGA